MGGEKVQMRKQLGLLNGVAIILGIIFGSGIFITPKEVLVKTGSVWASLTVWTLCGVLATLGALSYAELGTTLAQSGGDYHYINEAYGPLPAFLYLWDAIFVFVPSTNAIMALTFANNILSPIFPNCPIDPIAKKLIAAVTICFFTFINGYNVKFTTRLQTVFMFTKISALLTIMVGGIVYICKGGTEHFEDGWAGTKTSIGDWSVGIYSGIFAYSGWNYLNFMTEELKDPFKNLPRAIYISLPLVTSIYVIANVAYLAVLGPNGVRATEAIAVDFAIAILGFMRWVMPFLVAMATVGGLTVHIMTSSRMCFAGARNGHMPELLAHINMHSMSPVPSLIFLMLVSMVMLIPDNLTTLITYCSVVESFFTTLSCSAVLWLRYKKPDLPRPIRVPTWIPVTFVFVSTILLLVPILSEPVAVVAGVLITLAGVPVYWALIRAKPEKVRDLSNKFTHTCQKLFMSAVEEKDD
ncbi:hypothetical protein ABMA28_000614 [Loxostege sticticalis]|uniref:Y+L amino acid transporter 2 n=1 Tax=Loxostege sticticalis TaxID=481309 RepID=A0ABD0TT46_LOXSC